MVMGAACPETGSAMGTTTVWTRATNSTAVSDSWLSFETSVMFINLKLCSN